MTFAWPSRPHISKFQWHILWFEVFQVGGLWPCCNLCSGLGGLEDKGKTRGRPGEDTEKQVDDADSQIMSGWKLVYFFWIAMCLDCDSELRMNRIYWIYWSFRGLPHKITVKICTNTVRALATQLGPVSMTSKCCGPPLECAETCSWSVSKLVVEWQNLDNEMICFFYHEHWVPTHPSMTYSSRDWERFFARQWMEIWYRNI